MKDRYILGSGGMAREILEYRIATEGTRSVKGFIVQNPKQGDDTVSGLTVYDESLFDHLDPEKTLLINGMGSPLRRRWIETLETRGFTFETFLHPTSVIGTSVRIHDGVIVSPYVVLTTDILIGKYCIINVTSTISHDVIIGSYSTIGPGCHIAGRVKVGESVFIGAGVTVKPGVNIGSNVYIGAGSVVVSDIPDGVLTYGNPSRTNRILTQKEWRALV